MVTSAAHAAIAIVGIHANVMATTVVNLAFVVKDNRATGGASSAGGAGCTALALDTCRVKRQKNKANFMASVDVELL